MKEIDQLERLWKVITELTAQRNQNNLDELFLAKIKELTSAKRVVLYIKEDTDNKSDVFNALELNESNAYLDYPFPIEKISDPSFARFLIDTHKKLFVFLQHQQRDEEWEEFYAWLAFWKVNAILKISGENKQEIATEYIELLLNIYTNIKGILDEGDRDQLTKLYNRKSFDYRFSLIAEKSFINKKQGHMPHFLGIFDVDHFKKINDTHGHLYGDEVLIRLAQLMRANFKKRDHLFRFGGEEFVALIDSPDLAVAEKVFDRFRNIVMQTEFPQIDRVTVSVGVSQIGEGDEPLDVTNRADQALYFAKKSGRNRVCLYETLLAEGKITAVKTDKNNNKDQEGEKILSELESLFG